MTGWRHERVRTAKAAGWRRIRALVWKESLQVVRDPSSFVVAFVLPMILLILFGYGISFDATHIRVGLVIEAPTAETAWFLASLSNTPFFDVRLGHGPARVLRPAGGGRDQRDRRFARRLLSAPRARRHRRASRSSPTAATPTRRASPTGYLQGAWQSWLDQRALAAGAPRARPASTSSRASGSTPSSRAGASWCPAPSR